MAQQPAAHPSTEAIKRLTDSTLSQSEHHKFTSSFITFIFISVLHKYIKISKQNCTSKQLNLRLKDKSLRLYSYIVLLLGMSIGVRLKVRTFGNKHPDGSNVRILFLDQIIVLHEHKCSLERTFIIKSYLIIIMIIIKIIINFILRG